MKRLQRNLCALATAMTVLKTTKFFRRLKMRKNVVSLLLPNDRRLAVPGSLLFAIPLCQI